MNTFIFDLDGTLLPMPSQEKFLDAYIKALSGKMITHGMEPQKTIQAVMSGTQLMIQNDGSVTNEEKFWQEFCRLLGKEARQLEEVFEDFYRNEFNEVKSTTCAHPLANECIQLLKEKGYQIALATNPLFPRVATHNRMLWAGLNPEDFDLITTYEVSSFCKPNLEYYKEVLASIRKKPEECIMVGNDVSEDMCASVLGMNTFLLKECLICPVGADITDFKQGDFNDLYDMIKELPYIK
ncbi:MAG: HAD family hydrolase [Herbinix sp.]|nr:HAD family hydrolase [Herbinix sp.]